MGIVPKGFTTENNAAKTVMYKVIIIFIFKFLANIAQLKRSIMNLCLSNSLRYIKYDNLLFTSILSINNLLFSFL